MRSRPTSPPPGPHPTPVRPALRLMLMLTILAVGSLYWAIRSNPQWSVPRLPSLRAPLPLPGDVLGRDSVETLSPAEATALIKKNYPAGVPGPAVGITKLTFHYRSQLPTGEFVTVYGRAYLPQDGRTSLPIFAFAPGTTGVGDQCAASLERPGVANWGDYDSHLSAYATMGYAAVTTDYEGMRDPTRIHHYMVGELEGRALLDAVRALRHLPQSTGRLSPTDVFLSGYSQGGHAAFWADKIAARYAPDIRPLGVVGFGPVMSVKQTLADVTRGANINWFGPDVLVSYADYYHESYPGILLPDREVGLTAKVLAHCIDTDLPYWGHTPVGLYTPAFIEAALSGTITDTFPEFAKQLGANEVGPLSTPSAKRINGGDHDNVVLPAQQVAAAATLCSSSLGPVQYVSYPQTTHYDTMLHSFSDTLIWMHALSGAQSLPSTCQVR